jgi:hypothetical protein
MNFVCQSVRALCQAVKQRFRQRGPGPHPFQGPRGLALPTGLLVANPCGQPFTQPCGLRERSNSLTSRFPPGAPGSPEQS